MALSPKWPVRRGLWTWHSLPQMIFSSSFGLWSWSTIHSQTIYSLGAGIYVYHSQSPPSHLQDHSTCNSARWLNLYPWFWSKWMVHEKWSPQRGFEPKTSRSWVFCLTTRPRVSSLFYFYLLNKIIIGFWDMVSTCLINQLIMLSLISLWGECCIMIIVIMKPNNVITNNVIMHFMWSKFKN